MKNSAWLWLAWLPLVVVGCSDAGQAPAGPATGSPPPSSAAGGPPPIQAPPPAAAPVQQKASEEHTERGIAAKKVGEGILATPAAAYMRIPDRVVFLNVQHAMNLYKGEKGALPKTHDEFMAEIIKANSIRLPELPDDSRYVYVPEKEELMIERTAMP
ncbi:MAG: hypothetical protein HYX69_21125 [Planctomycetia bacterium]|nr:hypothetical protein [Planctomycetia bacterium]